MLKILRRGDTYSQACALLMGAFDGLHRGHGTLLQAAKGKGLPVGITAIAGAKRGGDLFTLADREYIFEKAGLDFVLELEFCDEVKNTPAERFLSDLFSEIQAKEVFCGEDFRFGKGALGTPALLKEYANCAVHVLPLQSHGGDKISASLCKKLLAEGNMGELNELLLHPYFVQGTVEHGRQVGRTYGFPTLNLTAPAEKLLPCEGVYGGFVETPKGIYRTIINVGARPTFGVEEKKLEAYLDGFSGDLYGETVRVYPTEYYRGVTKFPSAEALKEQLNQDIKRLRGSI